jgi:hypothetical protein
MLVEERGWDLAILRVGWRSKRVQISPGALSMGGDGDDKVSRR